MVSPKTLNLGTSPGVKDDALDGENLHAMHSRSIAKYKMRHAAIRLLDVKLVK